MFSKPKQSPIKISPLGSAGLCLCLAASAVSVHATQDASAIQVTPQSAEKRETPFACSMEKSLTQEQREHKKQIAIKMQSARTETIELPDGYLFRFRPDAISFADVADWAATERVCCPFFDLAVSADRENGPLSLRITGREGVKQFIRADFHILKVG